MKGRNPIISFCVAMMGVLCAVAPVQAQGIDLELIKRQLELQYVPMRQAQAALNSPAAMGMAASAVTGSQKPYYNGNSSFATAWGEDATHVVSNFTEFLGAMEYTPIGICYRCTILPPSCSFSIYFGYYYPTHVYEVADMRQSEYAPPALFDALDSVGGLEENWYPHVDGSESWTEGLGWDAKGNAKRGYQVANDVAGRIGVPSGPANPSVPSPPDLSLIETISKDRRWHSGKIGNTNYKETRTMSHILQMIYAESGGGGLLKHKRASLLTSSLPIWMTEYPYLMDFAHTPEASHFLYPQHMGVPLVAGNVPDPLTLKWNGAKCMGHNILRGNTPFFQDITGSGSAQSAFPQLLGKINNNGASVPLPWDAICSENLGPDYPVTMHADTPISRIPTLLSIRANRLLMAPLIGSLAGQGMFYYKKRWQGGRRADKWGFRSDAKESMPRFLANPLRNNLWGWAQGNRVSLASDRMRSPESFLSPSHRPGIDASDPGRYVVHQWSGFRMCQSDSHRPLLIFPFVGTGDSRNPEIEGYETS